MDVPENIAAGSNPTSFHPIQEDILMKNKSLNELQKACDDFNDKYPVGTDVFLKKDFVDEPVRTSVRHEAYVLSGHTAVAFFSGISGCYDIKCVTGKA